MLPLRTAAVNADAADELKDTVPEEDPEDPETEPTMDEIGDKGTDLRFSLDGMDPSP